MILIMGLVFVLSFTLTFYYREFALHHEIIDIPNERSAHRMPIPRGGGMVFITIFYALLIVLWLMNHIATPVFLAFLGGLPIAAVGYLDDLLSIKIYYRFLVHLLSAVWGVAVLGLLHSFYSIIPILLTVWFVNFYNFMDGIDGIAATQAIYITFVAGILFYANHAIGFSTLCLGVFAALMGFLYWNWQPAKIFMGDAGSGFLGYFFAILMFSSATTVNIPILFWLILMAVFLCDTTCTLLYRIQSKKKWYLAHREHIYQRVVQSGWSHAQVDLILMLINGVILLPISFFYLRLQTPATKLILIVFVFIVFSSAWLWLHKRFPILNQRVP